VKRRWQNLEMKKRRKSSKETATATVLSVNREMQRPRLTESVRNGGRDQTAPVEKSLPMCQSNPYFEPL